MFVLCKEFYTGLVLQDELALYIYIKRIAYEWQINGPCFDLIASFVVEL